MSILNNAIDSIIVGLEDYEASQSDRRRLLSCARNVYSGVLLLFKEKLSRLSPPGSNEVLVKKKSRVVTDASGSITWMGDGKNTVDYEEIKKRFNHLGIVVDWKRVSEIRDYRNDIEHYFDRKRRSPNSAQRVIADCFVVIRDFVSGHLGENPADLLGNDVWDLLTGVARDYEGKRKECCDRIDQIEWQQESLRNAMLDFKCPECGSGLIDVREHVSDQTDATLRCRDCGKSWGFDGIVDSVIGSYYSYENYLSVTDGAKPGTAMCPFCGRDTYVLEDDVCVVCDERAERECRICRGDITPSDLSEDGQCSHCAHMMAKND